ncbi:MAG: hypothetical protein ABJE99_03915 [Roseobacter sp.]
MIDDFFEGLVRTEMTGQRTKQQISRTGDFGITAFILLSINLVISHDISPAVTGCPGYPRWVG